MLWGGQGNDRMTGGAKADTFEFRLADLINGETDRILDFAANFVDKMRFFGVTRDDLTVSASGKDTLISYADSTWTLILKNVDVPSIGSSDFEFI